MGLAGPKVKQRFGVDPRNTIWSNDVSRFGHRHLEKLGWKPGMGLGMVPDATTTHVKVTIKADNLGLGSKFKKENKDEFDSGECTGLDVFQRILGRLNGKEQAISKEIERQRNETIINGKWGIDFVKGDVLASTWDTETKTLKSYTNNPLKRSKKDNERKEKRRKSTRDETNEKDMNLDKEKKRNKLDKTKRKKSNKEKSKKKDKTKKLKKDNKTEITRDNMLKPKEYVENVTDILPTRLSVRSRWIKQKRAAVMDTRALNEIFMVTS